MNTTRFSPIYKRHELEEAPPGGDEFVIFNGMVIPLGSFEFIGDSKVGVYRDPDYAYYLFYLTPRRVAIYRFKNK